MARQKPTQGNIIPEERESDFVAVTKKGKKQFSDEYSRTIKKIASYSGVVRRAELNDKSGKFDEIINIYVYPDGAITTEYENKVADRYTDQNSISKHSVRKNGEMGKSIWGKKERDAGYTPKEQAAARHKKQSRPIRRIMNKKGNSHKRK